MELSQFRLVSFGFAAENKALDSKELEVTPVESVPYQDGEMLPNPTDFEYKGKDGNEKAFNVKVTAANSIVATWLQWGSNRSTAPDVRRGERILLYQYGDSDTYYWVCPGMDDNLRRLETVTWVFSATQDEKVKVLTPDNSYSIEVSTHRKTITLKTSKANKEPFAYVFQFNMADGAVVLADDDSNYLELDSAERRWTIKNKDTSHFIMDKKDISIFAPENIRVKTKNLYMESQNQYVQNTNYDLKSSKWTINAAETTWTGKLTYSGQYSASGTGTWNGTYGFTGGLTSNGTNISNSHFHGNGNNGSPTTAVAG